MATALAAQLQAIASAVGGGSQSRPRGKPSLLYDYQEAADIDLHTLLHVALQGLQVLTGVDARFQQFKKLLFNSKVMKLDRMQLSKAQNQGLDTSIRSFLSLLADHLLLPAAFQTLEYLIRAYRINELNVNDVIMAFLPYHSTNEFVRIVQVCNLQSASLWQFLQPIQKSGAAMPREVLVQRCVNDKAVFDAVCKMAGSNASSGSHCSRVVMSFYAVTACEVIAAMNRVDEMNAALLLPYLLAGFGAEAPGSYRTASYMVAAQLCCHATLGAKLMEALVTEVCKSVAAEQLPEMVMLLCHFASSQPNFTSFPDAAYKFLVKVPGLVSTLDMVASKQLPVHHLLKLLLPFAVDHAVCHPVYEEMAIELITTLPIEDHVEALSSRVLSAAATKGTPEADKKVLRNILRCLNSRFPLGVDAAVNKAMETQQKQEGKPAEAEEAVEKVPPPVTDAALSKKKKKKHKKLMPAGVAASSGEGVVDFLNSTFCSTLRQPLEASGTTLMVAVDAHEPHIRKMALEKLDSLVAEAPEGTELRSFFHAAIIRSLQDDQGEVLAAVLNLRHLMEVPPQPLFDGLSACLTCASTKKKGTDTKLNKFVTKKVLQLLGGRFLQLHGSFLDEVVAVLTNHLALLSTRQRKVAATALEIAKAIDHPIFKGLVDFNPTPPGDQDPSSGTNTQSSNIRDATGTALVQYNTALVDALAGGMHLTDTPTTEAFFSVLHKCSPPGQTLLLLALAKAPAGEAVVKLLLDFRQVVWPSVAEATVGNEGSFPAGAPVDVQQVLGRLASKGGAAAALGAALLHVLLVVLQGMADKTVANIGHQVFSNALRQLAQDVAIDHWQPHISTIVDNISHNRIDQAAFLAEIFLAPAVSSAGSKEAPKEAAIKTGALQQLSRIMGEQCDAAAVSFVLPFVFCVLSSPKKGIRKAALGCVKAILSSMLSSQSSSPKRRSSSNQSGLLHHSHAIPLLSTVMSHADAIKRDGTAVLQLLRSCLSVGGAPRSVGKSAKKGKAKENSQETSDVVVDEATKAAVQQYLLAQLPVLHPHPWKHQAALLLVEILHGVANEQETLRVGSELLRKLLESFLSGQSPAEINVLSVDLAVSLIQLYRSDLLAVDKAGIVEGHALEVLLSILQSGPSAQLPDAIRVAALHQVTADMYSSLEAAQKLVLLRSLLRLNSTTDVETVREAARNVLNAVPLPAAVIAPLLHFPDDSAGEAEGLQSSKKRKVKNSGRAKAALDALETPKDVSFEECTAVLELLQWKDGIEDCDALTAPLYSLVHRLTTLVSHESHDATNTENDEHHDDDDDDDEEMRSPGATKADANGPGRFVHASYALSLALSFLARLATGQTQDELHQHQLPLILSAARCARDGMVRTAALKLLAEAARKLPEQTLRHVMELLSILSESATALNDSYSIAILCDTLAAVVAPWLEGGRDVNALITSALDTLATVDHYKSTQLMVALLSALPKETGLQVMVVELLKRAVECGPSTTGGDSASDRDRMLDLASHLSSHCPLQYRLVQYCSILEACLEAAEKVPQHALPILATAFVTQQIKGLSAKAASEEFQGAFHRIIEQVVKQLQLVAALSSSHSSSSTETATQGCYSCLEALEDVMEAAGYLEALVQLLPGCQSDAVCRKAVRLVVDKVLMLQQEAQVRADASASPVVSPQLLSAALRMCQEAAALVREGSPASALTQQQALICIGTLAPWLAQQHSKQLLDTLKAVLQVASNGYAGTAVRSSALAAAAASIRSLGTRCVPLLPLLVPTVLHAAQQASDKLATIQKKEPPQQGDTEDDVSLSSQEEEGDDSSAIDDVALQLSSALACVMCGVEAVGPFLSPYLEHMLPLILGSSVLQCEVLGVAQVAGQIREKLAGSCPPRLLLPALLGCLDCAVQCGDDSTIALLELTKNCIISMDTTTATAQHEAVFRFLCRALDLRRQRPSSVSGISAVEDTAVAAFVSLTLKLSERCFKPMFLRLLDWAHTRQPEDPDCTSRSISLVAVVDGLLERLRGLFVPYFRHLLDEFIAVLGGARDVDATPRKKKRKSSRHRGEENVGAAAGGGGEGAGVTEGQWVQRFKVVRVLHRLFLYDTVQFLDDVKFSRLIDPLVRQLEAQPPADTLALIQHCDRGSDLDADIVTGEHSTAFLDVYGKGVVSCLAQFAVTGGKDEAWKALNQQVLLCTRSESARTRLLSLEVVSQLIHQLREEYLTYLPDTIPFLAELLEDTELAVEARVKEVVKQLEELSGESLEQYMQT